MLLSLLKALIFLMAMAATGCLASPPCDNGDGRTPALCSQYINPFSVNEYVWGTLLGIELSSPNVLMADRIEFWDDIDGCSEPQTTVATCCVSISEALHPTRRHRSGLRWPRDDLLSKIRLMTCQSGGP